MKIYLIIPIFLLISNSWAKSNLPIVTFSSFEADDPLVHVIGKVLDTAYQRIGYQLKVEHLPGQRSIIEANNGNTTGELYRVKEVGDMYSNLVRIPIPIYIANFTVFSKKKNIQIKKWEDLRPYLISYNRGSKLIEKRLRGFKTETSITQTITYKKLDQGRTDLVVDDIFSGKCLIRKLNLTNIFMLEPSLETVDTFHFVHKSHPEIIKKISKALEEMKANGEIEQIQKKQFALALKKFCN